MDVKSLFSSCLIETPTMVDILETINPEKWIFHTSHDCSRFIQLDTFEAMTKEISWILSEDDVEEINEILSQIEDKDEMANEIGEFLYEHEILIGRKGLKRLAQLGSMPSRETCKFITKVCEECGSKDETKLIFGPHPYTEEICGDKTEVWLCEECYKNALGDI